MGRMGPAPTSAKVLKLHGERKKRDLVEPQPLDEPCLPPDYLASEARAVFEWAARHVNGMGILYAADAEMLAVFADSVVQRARCSVIAASAQPLIVRPNEKTGRPSVMPNPIGRELRLWSDQVRRNAAEFGLSPRGRRELAALAMGEWDPRAALLS